ncbi:hypothetical protein C0214_19780 [Methylobacterium sp. DM1]|nr:hypothetical protein C0214_19780 [Methylobacterium sp. DM1]
MANQGIDHIAFSNGGKPLCGNNRALMSITIDRFRADAGTGRYCVRCVRKLAAMDERAAKKSRAA